MVAQIGCFDDRLVAQNVIWRHYANAVRSERRVNLHIWIVAGNLDNPNVDVLVDDLLDHPWRHLRFEADGERRISMQKLLDRVRHHAEAHGRHRRDAQATAPELADFACNPRQTVETDMTARHLLVKLRSLRRDEQSFLVTDEQGKSDLPLEVGKATAGAWLRDIEEAGRAAQASSGNDGVEDVKLMGTESFRRAQPVAVEATLAIGERGFAAWAFLDWSIGFPFAIRPPLSLAAILLHDLSRLRFGPARTHHPICIFRGRLVVSPSSLRLCIQATNGSCG